MDTCNLCGGTRWRTLEEVAGRRVVRCACGMVFVTPQPGRATLEQAYNADYYRPWKNQARIRAHIWRVRANRAAALSPPPGRLLDVGSGTGDFLRQVRSRGWEVTGTELSPAGTEMARAHGIEIMQGEIWEAGLPSGAFDIVTCWHVIEHATDPRRMLTEIHRILRPGGWLILATPNLEDHIFRVAYRLARGRRPHLYEPNEREVHLFVFSPPTLRRLAVSIGYERVTLGFDRGAATVWGKRVVDALAYAWFRLSGKHWGMALEMTARKALVPQESGT